MFEYQEPGLINLHILTEERQVEFLCSEVPDRDKLAFIFFIFLLLTHRQPNHLVLPSQVYPMYNRINSPSLMIHPTHLTPQNRRTKNRGSEKVIKIILLLRVVLMSAICTGRLPIIQMRPFSHPRHMINTITVYQIAELHCKSFTLN